MFGEPSFRLIQTERVSGALDWGFLDIIHCLVWVSGSFTGFPLNDTAFLRAPCFTVQRHQSSTSFSQESVTVHMIVEWLTHQPPPHA